MTRKRRSAQELGYHACAARVLDAVNDWARINPGVALVFDYDKDVVLIGTLKAVGPTVCACDDARKLVAFVDARVPDATWMMLRASLEILYPSPSGGSA